MADFTHKSGAQENEAFASSLDEDVPVERNWIVTVRFYSLLHYVDIMLKKHGYMPEKHGERFKNIEQCQAIDPQVYKKYKTLFDLSRDARYERIRMDTTDVAQSAKVLEEGKELLGFGSTDGTHKYST